MDASRNTTDPMRRFAGARIYNRVRRMFTGWNKADLINHIARLRGYRTYLEICNDHSGFRFGEIDRAVLPTRHRLVYQCAPGYSDGQPIDFSAGGLDSSECIRAIRAQNLLYDIILVDPWHEYATSFRDLNDAMTLLTQHGTVVVHDCRPPSEDHIKMPFVEGFEWSGVTYRAFLDFVVQRSLDYRLVDIDFGCGVIRNRTDVAAPSEPRRELLKAWAAIGDDESAAFRFMQQHAALWNVVPLRDFIRTEARDAAQSHNGNRAASTSSRLVQSARS
jgi:hypothetical protein